MNKKLKGKKIAILACEGFEEVEMTKPRALLKKAGADIDFITPDAQAIKSWAKTKWGKKFKVDVQLKDANPADYDLLLLPGGVINPDKLRTNKSAVKFVNHFFKNKKWIAAICHAPLTLIETNRLKGRTVTSYHSIKTDLKNAGASWKNKEVVVDKNLITSRNPKDIPAFTKTIIKVLST